MNNNKVIIKVGGGLGNQLFCYAMYRFWEQKGVNVYFDVDDPFCNRYMVSISIPHTVFKLPEYFPDTNFRTIKLSDYKNEFSSMIDLPFSKLLSISDYRGIILKILRKIKYIYPGYSYKYPDDIFIEEPWNRHEYFTRVNKTSHLLIQKGWFFLYEPAFTIRDILLTELEFSNKLPDYIENLLLDIVNNTSVAVHVRRGDYIIPEYYYRVGYVCTKQYYKNAIDYISTQYQNLKFYIFSNDREWVKRNFQFLNNYVIIDTSREKMSPYYDMFLMSKCKHNIIANSTFSWWGAFLNRNTKKTVIVPTEFEGKYITIDEICPPDWIRVPTVIAPRVSSKYIYEEKE
jgi:hypothetical protein